MSAAVRFLFVAVAGWTAFRAMSVGIIPGAEAFAVARAQPAPPPIIPTEFAPLDPVQAQSFLPEQAPMAAAAPALHAGYAPVPAYHYYYGPPAAPPPRAAPAGPVAAAAISPRAFPYTPLDPDPAPLFYAPIPHLDEWPLSRIASGGPARSSAPVAGASPVVPSDRLDRLQLTAWAFLRREPGTGALASGGTLGGSQAGARLTYAFNRHIGASLRSSSPVGGSRGGEVAAGIRVTPFRSIPVAVTAERRQAIGRFSTGRSDFALFLEGGVYQQPLPWHLSLDAYAQAGIVGIGTPDMFADGGFTVMRPVFGRFSAGVGAWGGVQPGLYRIDAGPRVSMRVRHNMRVDLDWRQRMGGQALPASGPAVTLAADF